MLYNVHVSTGYFQGINLGNVDANNRKEANEKIEKLLMSGITKENIELRKV